MKQLTMNKCLFVDILFHSFRAVGVIQSMRQEVFCARAHKNGEKSGDIASNFLDAFHLFIDLRTGIISHFYVFGMVVLFFHFFLLSNYFTMPIIGLRFP